MRGRAVKTSRLRIEEQTEEDKNCPLLLKLALKRFVNHLPGGSRGN